MAFGRRAPRTNSSGNSSATGGTNRNINSDDLQFTVSALNAYVKEIFDTDEILQSIDLEGEITDFRPYASGHWYFALKDADSQIRGVMWKTDALRNGYKPENGTHVRVHGRVSIYAARGEYQISCDLIQPIQAVGDLEAQLRALFDKLQTEGLFEEAIKRPIPRYPARIGVVTSAGAAAWQDVQNVLRRRFPIAEVLLSPTLVQGMDAPPRIVRALQRVDRAGVDVILLVRGGGSKEDLWCFNDERIVRAIRATRVPVITGVGHEIDNTLVDYAADLRAPTPSVAGERATPELTETRLHVAAMTEALSITMLNHIAEQRGSVESYARELEIHSPRARIAMNNAGLTDRIRRLERAMQSIVAKRGAALESLTRAVERANPEHLLARGYAVVARPDGTRLRSVQQITPNDDLRITFADGTQSVRATSASDR